MAQPPRADARRTQALRTLVIGLGVQGEKRRRHAGCAYIGAVDPNNPDADFPSLDAVPEGGFDMAVLCTPDAPKAALIERLIDAGKHVLVEKPLWAADETAIRALEAKARARGVAVRAAYNHRFEPHFQRMAALLASGALGRVYRCRLFYGNGTARLVRDSAWRDAGSGVIHDLGSHLLDTALYWFGQGAKDTALLAPRLRSASCYENRAPDHAAFEAAVGGVTVEAEMTLLSWRNHFTADVFAENGTAHIASLCKWGPATFVQRRRVLPAGRPPEETVTLRCEDPTWAAEDADFRGFAAAVERGEAETDLSRDAALNTALRALGNEAAACTGCARQEAAE